MEGYLFGDEMEIFDLYNIRGEKLNRTMVRGDINQDGEYHRVVHIWIRRSNGDYLIQQRNKASDKFPYQWAPTAGAINQGESSTGAALRETYEEIGIRLTKEDLIHTGQYPVDTKRANYIVDQYLVVKDIDLSHIVIDPIEVKRVMYASVITIEEMAKSNTFWDYHSIDKDYLDALERRTK